jgi:dTDP-4-dehydrorhamnose 3,5-epimerase
VLGAWDFPTYVFASREKRRLKVIETKLPGVFVVEPKVFGDERGFFMETWHVERYREAGLPSRFVQDNLSFSRRSVLRGLHFQNPDQQGKLVYVLQGEVYDVAVDIRVGSPTFGEWVAATLSSENKRQLYIPEGFAHGFLVTSDAALFAYKCTAKYNAKAEASVLWNDLEIGIEWPDVAPVVSEKDRAAPTLGEMPVERLPEYRP